MNLELQESLSDEFQTIDKNRIFEKIYFDHFPVVKTFVLANNGNLDDANDLFQETLIILLRKLEEDDFVLTAKLKTYLFAIAKNLWHKHLRDNKRTIRLTEDYQEIFYSEIDSYIDKEKSETEKLLAIFSQISQHCNKLIHDIFYKSESIEEIKENYKYTSKHNAQNQKHKCIKQMKIEKIRMFG